MATKKKPKKKQPQPRKAAPRKKSAKKKLAKKKAPAKKIAKRSKQATARKKASTPKKKVRGKSQRSYPLAFAKRGPGASSGGQSGDLQGLSRIEGVDSESVNELIEEGNAFEADVVQGVTDAGDADGGEVHTHEVPEDDVPGEYLDKD
ncbi:MAG: hypothetical protein LAO18_00780 [Acidobacteriia bacterium]|jgi:hypothetical protein|nr:hypothetical protein [Terriglobia bacterium]